MGPPGVKGLMICILHFILGTRTWSTNSLLPRPGDLSPTKTIHGPTIPARRQHYMHILQTEMQSQHRPAESVCRICQEHMDTHQHLAPSCWRVFLQTIRTNNDVEGWHNGLNQCVQGKTQLPLYVLIQFLQDESRPTSLQIRMERKLCRIQRRTYRQIQSKIFSLWDQFENGDRTSKQLLRTCSELYGPRDNPSFYDLVAFAPRSKKGSFRSHHIYKSHDERMVLRFFYL